MVLGSTVVSGIGDWLYFTAFAVWIYDRTDSAVWLAAAATSRLLAYVILGPLGGAAAARFRRQSMMVVLDASRAGVMIGLALIVVSDGSPLVGTLVTVAASVLTVPYRPALAAATPYVVPTTALAAANGAEAIAGQLTVFAGPALATVLITIGSPSLAIALNALTFVVSAVFIIRAGDLGGGSSVEQPAGADDGEGTAISAGGEPGTVAPRPGILGEIVTGWKVLVTVPGLLVLNMLVVLTLFTFGAEGVLHVIVAEDGLGEQAAFVGALTAAIGIGGLLASPLTGRIAASPNPGPWLIACAVLQGAPLVALGFISSPVVALVLLAFEGVGVIVFEVLAITLLQRLAGDQVAQVFGIQDSMSAATQLLGGIAAPVLLVAGLPAACAVGGGVLVAFGVVAAPALLRCGRIAEVRALEVAPVADALADLGLLEGAGRASVEAVAAAVIPTRFAAGTTVIEEGDPADDLYVIRSGSFLASAQATGVLRTMGAGDWFGEIGVLERRRRTATVIAETDSEVWRIPGQSFLDALRDLATLPDPLHRGVAARLAFSAEIEARSSGSVSR